LRKGNFTGPAAEVFGEALSNMPNLIHLDIANNSLEPAGKI
jgi:hypothetical protein